MEEHMVSLRLIKLLGAAALVVGLLCMPASAAGQWYNQSLVVDCSGNDPNAYTSFSAAMQAVTDSTGIWVRPGTVCNDNIYLNERTYVGIFTDQGSTFTLNGNLTIQNSRSVWIYGIQVTNTGGDGIYINNSNPVTLDDCASSGNAGGGLNIAASNVIVNHTGVFDYNAGGGVGAGSNSMLTFSAWYPANGHFEMIGNTGHGLDMDRSVVEFSGSTTIANTVPSAGGTFPDGFGIIAWGGAKGFLLDMTGPNVVANNAGGGIFLGETSEMSTGGGMTWAPYPFTIQGNGPYGIYAAYGSQVTVIGDTQIVDHTIAGVDVFSGSEANIWGTGNQIMRNGTGLDAGRAGIRVDGNSQAYVHDTTIAQNGGPGIFAVVNSSVDAGNDSIVSNAGGAVGCDGTSVLKSDLTPAVLGPANACRAGSGPGFQRHGSMHLPQFDQQQWKAYVNKMHAMMAAHKR
jgi:hypothetical protein